MSWGPSTGTSAEASPVRVRSGEALDVLIMVTTSMDDLIASGHFIALQRMDVAVRRLVWQSRRAIRRRTSAPRQPFGKPC